MASKPGIFYRFIGIHSFLIGLFPFYIPVYLWKNGETISSISLFIGLTGVGFCLALWAWDRLRLKTGLLQIIVLSFVLELVLLGTLLSAGTNNLIVLLGLLNGFYNCLFWMTNRALFYDLVNPSNSGEKFGNLQIVVVVVLKIGIFSGGLLLDQYGLWAVFLGSMIISLIGTFTFWMNRQQLEYGASLKSTKPLKILEVFNFKDLHGSRMMFSIDGIFLYLESYFWTISLFLIVKESFWELGVLVVILMVLFGLIFLLVKNSIDKLPLDFMYRLAVSLYAVSWLLRSFVYPDLSLSFTFTLLVLITFFTSLFRLTFNKRFFDLAKNTSNHRYIIIKSYYSQFFIGIFFGAIWLLLGGGESTEFTLSIVYFLTAFLALLFLWYETEPNMVNMPSIPFESHRHKN